MSTAERLWPDDATMDAVEAKLSAVARLVVEAEEVLHADEGDEQVPTNAIELDGWIDYQLQLLAGIDVEMKQNREVMQRIVAPLQEKIDRAVDWCETENAGLARRAEWITSRIREHTQGYDYRGRKSRTLPNGKFGTRQKPSKLEIADKQAAVAFALANGVPVREIPAKVEPDARELKAYAESTGITPDGCTLIEARVEFFADAVSASRGQ